MTQAPPPTSRTLTQTSASDDLAGAITGLRALVVAGEQLRNAIAAHYAIGVSETTALSHLRIQDGLSPHELAERIGMTPSTMTSLLDRLETGHFVSRSPHPTDRRRTIITLTDAGAELLTYSDQWLNAAIARLGADALPNVAATLNHLAASLAEQATTITNLPPARHTHTTEHPSTF